MVISKRAVIVGIPGVGKTTVISKVSEILKERMMDVEHVVFGTIMFEEATKMGVKDRDEMRKLPVERQKELQVAAALTIAKAKSPITLIDTHLFIKTKEGYWPGLPGHVIDSLSPTNLILVEASPGEIISRRENDATRSRDVVSAASIEDELAVGRRILATAGVLAGAPIMTVKNEEGKIDTAAAKIADSLVS